MKKAFKELYNDLIPFPDVNYSSKVKFIIKEKDYKKVDLGFCPMNMEDKWFIYEESDVISMYRSWSNICIAKLSICQMNNDDYLIYKIQINGDANQYKTTGNKSDIDLIIKSLEFVFNIKISNDIEHGNGID